MPFPFTFRLSVPGLSNPFSAPSQPYYPHHTTHPQPPVGSDRNLARAVVLSSHHNRPYLHSPQSSTTKFLPAPLPISRKRGWEPSDPEPTQSTTSLHTPTRGYLARPWYREMDLDAYQRAMAEDTDMAPPTKRRRSLAGSIVTTALNAALIGTAVGLTMYRLWRDRGKPLDRLLPPPPYQEEEEEWVPPPNNSNDNSNKRHRQTSSLPSLSMSCPPSSSSASSASSSSPPPPPTPHSSRSRRSRQSLGSKKSLAHRKAVGGAAATATVAVAVPRRSQGGHHHHHHHHHHHPASASVPTVFPPAQPEFDFGADGGGDEEQDHMDWIGDKLSMLIEEGKKALGREVVVMSDSKEDEVDDGDGAWEEEEEEEGEGEEEGEDGEGEFLRGGRRRVRGGSTPASSSLSYKRSAAWSPTYIPSAYHRSHSHSQSEEIRAPSSSSSRGLGVMGRASASATSLVLSTGGGVEDEREWESPEMKEYMERARAKVLAMRSGRGV